jgi:DNA-binding MarR family transcriptional regulator
MAQGPPYRGTPPPEVEKILCDLFQVEDAGAFKLFTKLKFASHLLHRQIGEHGREGRLTAARTHLLIRLAVEKRRGNEDSISPSDLSHFLGVSRNTISALLNGLEEQDLIERHLHPTDRRQFLIHITPNGEKLIRSHMPNMVRFVAGLLSSLTEEERETLTRLLDKLIDSLLDNMHSPAQDTPSTEESDPIIEHE